MAEIPELDGATIDVHTGKLREEYDLAKDLVRGRCGHWPPVGACGQPGMLWVIHWVSSVIIDETPIIGKGRSLGLSVLDGMTRDNASTTRDIQETFANLWHCQAQEGWYARGKNGRYHMILIDFGRRLGRLLLCLLIHDSRFLRPNAFSRRALFSVAWLNLISPLW